MSPINYYNIIVSQMQYLVYLEFVHDHPLIGLHLADDALERAHIAPGKGGINEPFTLGTVVVKTPGEFWVWSELTQITHSANLGRSQGVQFWFVFAYQNLFTCGLAPTYSFAHSIFCSGNCHSAGF